MINRIILRWILWNTCKQILSQVSDSEMQVASILVDPDSGAVRALTGGMNYVESQYNRASLFAYKLL